jgi:hypothetical protein
MRLPKSLIVASLAAAAVAGGAMAASGPQVHMLIVRLPNGAVEQIRYYGDVPPKVVVMRGPTAADPLGPAAFFGQSSPFAAMDRISAQMDRQMAAMMAQAHAVQAKALAGAAGGLQQTAVGQLPAGAQSVQTVSTFSGGHACTKSVEVISQGAGKAPQVISKSSGDCAPAATPGAALSPGASGGAQTIETKATKPATHPGPKISI